MKKLLVITLTLALLLALASPALGFSIQRSRQNLVVDGKNVACDKYNIDGSNYFKLRDLAQLLNGTGSQFDVGWDADRQLVSVSTGKEYTTPNGTELQVGEDKSATAVLSAQTIMIDGTVRRDLTVYNIGGSNFFKLREMGDALGFDVDYDKSTDTAIVKSRGGPASGSDIRVSDLCDLTGCIANSAGYVNYYSFRLPSISGADTDYIRSVNAAVQEIYEQRIQVSLSNLQEYGSLSCFCAAYKYAVVGGIHSLIITTDSDWGADYFWCFNFDDAGNEVSNADVLKAAGLTQERFLEIATVYLSAYTDLSGMMDDSFWKPLQEQTLSEENLNAGIPMALLPDGSVCFIATVYTPAGAGVYDKALAYNTKTGISEYNQFGNIMIYRFSGCYLVDNASAGLSDDMRYLLDFITIGGQPSVEVTAFDPETGSVYYYYASDLIPANADDLMRGDLDSIRIGALSYCPDVNGGSYYGEAGVYDVRFTGDTVVFSGFGGGTPLLGSDSGFTARRVYRDDIDMSDGVPEVDSERFNIDDVIDSGLTGVWSGGYTDLAGEAHELTLEISMWGTLRLRDTCEGDIPRLMEGSYYIAREGDDAPAGDVVFNLVSRAGYKMPYIGSCTMTPGGDGTLRITESLDLFASPLTMAGAGVTVTLSPAGEQHVPEVPIVGHP